MKSRIMKKCSVLIVVVLLFSILLSISFADNESVPETRFTYIDSYDGLINQGLIKTMVKASVAGSSSVTKVKIKMELQKQTSGNYTTVETWEQTFTGRNGEMEESKTTNPLSRYRLKATVTAYSGSNSESHTFFEY